MLFENLRLDEYTDDQLKTTMGMLEKFREAIAYEYKLPLVLVSEGLKDELAERARSVAAADPTGALEEKPATAAAVTTNTRRPAGGNTFTRYADRAACKL